MRPRRGIAFGIFFLVLLAVLIAVVPHRSDRSKTLPPGHWGQTIACLEHNALFEVDDAAGRIPDRHTTDVQLLSEVHHTDLARLRDAGTAQRAQSIARARSLGRDATRYRTAGSIAWALQEGGDPPHILANPGDRALIDFCGRTPDARR